MRVRVCNNAIPPKSQRQTSKDPGDPSHPRQPRAKDLRPSIPMTTKCPPWPWEEGGPGRSSNSQGKGCQETRGSGQLTLLEASHPRSLRTARNPAEPPPHDGLSQPQESRPEHKLKQTFQRNCNKSFYLFVNMVCGNFSAVYCAQIWWCQVQTLAVVHVCHCSLIGLLMWLSDFCISS